MELKAVLMDDSAIKRSLTRIAHEIIERNHGTENIVVIGIRSRGVPLAKTIAENIKNIEAVQIPVGELDIKLYRDDLTQAHDSPEVNTTKIDFDIKKTANFSAFQIILLSANWNPLNPKPLYIFGRILLRLQIT